MSEVISFGKIVPLVPAIDMDEVIQFYEEELGFTKLFENEDFSYAGLGKDAIEFHLYKTNDQHLAHWSVIRLQTDEIEKLYDQLKDKEYIHPNDKLRIKEYGLKEFSIVDPSGVLVTFFKKV
jgi:uncharacterized glyoxalase superfamily protein PhnB